ncbi:MAG: TolC family protein [Proteobacteria bacterium]|nr:TolC family protein [Pseudomonadota bacterium]
MRKLPLSLALAALLWAQPAAAALTLEKLLDSSARHYPKVQKSLAGIEVGQGKVQAARGAFDWELNQKAISRVSGFYSGDYAESQITRRLADSAVRVHGGYRVSDGGFPVYEDELVTLDSGEFNAGITLSLWRNRIVDEERFQLRDSELELEQRRVELLLTQLGVQYDAMQAYFSWVAAGKALKVSEGLLQLAQQRQKGFKARVARGDMADIYLTENQQYIAKRSADVNEARRQLENRATKLSLFWRDEDGNPVLPRAEDLPADFPVFKALAINLGEEIERARTLRPELIRLNLGMQRERNKMQLGENKLMPKVDLKVEGARDIGDATAAQRSRVGTEGKIGLSISIPLQRNTGEGLVKQSQNTLRQLEHDSRLLNDQIATEIQIAANNYHVASENLKLAGKEISATLAMEQAERERFEGGAVDYFVLNMREERAGDARMKQVDAQLKLWLAIADYYLATLQAEKLRISS